MLAEQLAKAVEVWGRAWTKGSRPEAARLEQQMAATACEMTASGCLVP